jgi:hypothetical protein
MRVYGGFCSLRLSILDVAQKLERYKVRLEKRMKRKESNKEKIFNRREDIQYGCSHTNFASVVSKI